MVELNTEHSEAFGLHAFTHTFSRYTIDGILSLCYQLRMFQDEPFSCGQTLFEGFRKQIQLSQIKVREGNTYILDFPLLAKLTPASTDCAFLSRCIFIDEDEEQYLKKTTKRKNRISR